MSDKRKKHKFDAKREARRLRALAEQERATSQGEMPRRSVIADQSQQVPNNSYSPAPCFYVDKDFVCIDCGKQETWTAQQQKWYYEVAKGSLYATAVRCRDCRKLQSERRLGQGDPNRVKHAGSLMKQIRSKIEPTLIAAGFEFDGRSRNHDSASRCLDYSRPGCILRCLFEPEAAHLIAETLDERASYRVLANVPLGNATSPSQLIESVDEFAATVIASVRAMPVAPRQD